MALLFIDGFDHYDINSMGDMGYFGNYVTSYVNISASYARYNGQGMRIVSSAYGLPTKNIGVAKSTLYLGVAVKKGQAGTPGTSAGERFITFYDESYVRQVTLQVNASYGISAYCDATLLGSTADGIFPDQEWFYLEIKVTISATVGEVTIRINETEVLSLTDQNTKNGDDYIRYFRLSGIYNDLDVYFDDLYVDDAQFHGDCQVKTFVPTGDSVTNTDFIRSEGSNDYECVDEAIATETDYIEGSSLNDKSTFDITTDSLPSVKGVQVTNYCKTTGTGDNGIKAICRSNSVDYQGTEVTPSADYKFYQEIWETDPDDSNPWTQTKLEAAEFGLEITTFT
jgi:hypothetical protein